MGEKDSCHCCTHFKRLFEEGEITKLGKGFWIYGKPRMASDGDGYFDDMTQEYSISFCPFCGTQLFSEANDGQPETTVR